ncbi:hypothetical protein ScPMuIL_017054, partial [Solemya velum]
HPALPSPPDHPDVPLCQQNQSPQHLAECRPADVAECPARTLGVSHHGRAGRSGHRPRREHATHPPPPRRGRPGCGRPTWAPTATCCRA